MLRIVFIQKPAKLSLYLLTYLLTYYKNDPNLYYVMQNCSCLLIYDGYTTYYTISVFAFHLRLL